MRHLAASFVLVLVACGGLTSSGDGPAPGPASTQAAHGGAGGGQATQLGQAGTGGSPTACSGGVGGSSLELFDPCKMGTVCKAYTCFADTPCPCCDGTTGKTVCATLGTIGKMTCNCAK
jgi:hypothetical protein